MTRALQKISAKRSAAAKRGWETRRLRSGAMVSVDISTWKEKALLGYALAERADPNPWPRFAATVRRWWLRATGWLR